MLRIGASDNFDREPGMASAGHAAENALVLFFEEQIMRASSVRTDSYATVITDSKRVRLHPVRRPSARLASRGLRSVFVAAATAALSNPTVALPADAPPVVPSVAVAAQFGSGSTAYEGAVEAVRQTIVAAQVPGPVVALQVRAGDKVHAGQVLMRIDARAADQTAAAGAAQARAARETMEMANRELKRQQQLFAHGFISQGALDGVDAHFKTAHASVCATGQRRGRKNPVRLQ